MQMTSETTTANGFNQILKRVRYAGSVVPCWTALGRSGKPTSATIAPLFGGDLAETLWSALRAASVSIYIEAAE
jgi:hypothetical protein